MCVLEAHDLIKTKTKVIGGKTKTYQERTPLATYAIAGGAGSGAVRLGGYLAPRTSNPLK